MSAESDLLFPQLDSFMLSDLSNFSDYEDFSNDIFIMSDIDGISLLEGLDSKDGLKPLLMSELNNFCSSLEGIKEEDEEEDMHSAKAHESKQSSDASQATSIHGDGLCSEGLIIGSEAENILVSPRTMLTTNDMSCMSLEEDILQVDSKKQWHALTLPCKQGASLVSTDGPSAQGDPMAFLQPEEAIATTRSMQSSCMLETPVLPPLRQVMPPRGRSRVMINNKMCGDTRLSIVPPIFHINSPVSSPSSSVSTPEGSSMFKMFGQDESINKRHMNTSLMQPTASIDVGLRSMQADSFHGVIPHHVMQEVSSFSTMHRSHSSHALGQFRMSGPLISCSEELSISSVQKPTMGHSSVSNFPAYQASSSPSLVERSSNAPMRRVFSTGDIQASYGDNSNLNCLEHTNNEEHTGLKVGHYTLEERKVRLDRYRQKRNERNFSKKIKYACRKTLADSRPRIRGRFARTLDDLGEPLQRENGASYDDDYEEVHDTLSAHCSSTHSSHSVNFWNVTGMNAGFQRGH